MFHRLLIYGLGLLPSLGVLTSLRAAVTDFPGEASFHLRRWTTEDGLPQNRITCLSQTRDGYLWLGTWAGLARFDGKRFTVFDQSNTPELVNDSINALVADTDGTLWIGTANGLVSYQEHQFRRFTQEDGLPDRSVWRLTASSSGGIWLHAGNSVARLQHGKFTRVWNMSISDHGTIHSMNEGADGWLDVLTKHMWLSMSPKSLEVRTNRVNDSTSQPWLTGLRTKSTGNLWLGTPQGLEFLDSTGLHPAESDTIGQRRADFIHEDRAGNLWVNMKPGGLFRRDASGWRAVDLEHWGDPASTLCMQEDREGNLWLGTEQGLVQLQEKRMRTYTASDGLPDNIVWSVCEATDGIIWVATDRGVSRIRNGRVQPLKAEEEDRRYSDRCVWPMPGGSVMIAKMGLGVFEYSDTLRQRADPGVLPSVSIFALYGDRAGRIWIGTEMGIVVLSDGLISATYTNWAGQSGYDVRCILEDRAGTFWIGTQGQGLTRLKDGKFDVFTERNGLSNNRVWSIHEDSEGVLWLGTENGLTRYHQGRFFTFRRPQGLFENAINWILEDDLGHLWLSGLRGIYRVKREQLNSVAEGQARSVQAAAFGNADGMQSSESNGEGQPSGWKSRDGRLWFPTTLGVVVIDPKIIEIREETPPVVIEQVRADKEVIFGDGAVADERNLNSTHSAISGRRNDRQSLLASAATIKLSPGRAQAVEIAYTANTFVDPKRTQFRTRLIGRDSNWREADGERVAHFTNLRPGNYRFEVAGANHHGVWSPTPASFVFTVAPHFWETWPFYGLCIAGIIGLAAGIQTYRLRWQHRLMKLEQQRMLANERTRIARDLHDDLGTALTGLALELDIIGRQTGKSRPVAEPLGETARRTRNLAERMREVVWSVNPKCDTLSSLASYLEQQISQFLHSGDMRVRLDFPEDIPAIPLAAEHRHHLALCVREALVNVVRHAQASEVVVTLNFVDQTLTVQIRDDGCGFRPQELTGHGLHNMHSRMKQIGGSFDCTSSPGQGTVIGFRLQIQKAASMENTRE